MLLSARLNHIPEGEQCGIQDAESRWPKLQELE